MQKVIFGIALAAVAMLLAYVHADAAPALAVAMSGAVAVDMEGLVRKFDDQHSEVKKLIEAGRIVPVGDGLLEGETQSYEVRV